jgi:hypothetical protein
VLLVQVKVNSSQTAFDKAHFEPHVIQGFYWADKRLKLSMHYAIRTYGGVDIYPPFLPSALEGCEWSASCPGHFILAERAHSTHWIGGWMSSRAGFDAVEKKKSFALPGVEPRPSIP